MKVLFITSITSLLFLLNGGPVFAMEAGEESINEIPYLNEETREAQVGIPASPCEIAAQGIVAQGIAAQGDHELARQYYELAANQGNLEARGAAA